ncbi:MAG: SpoIIE family protein phosphatase, partial [Planctomycetota bacterium]
NPETLVQAMNRAVRFRAIAMLAILIAVSIVNALRLATDPNQSFSNTPLGVHATIHLLTLYESGTLWWLFRGRDDSKPLPGAWAYVNAIVECTAPTTVVFFAASATDISLEAAALGPASHLYAIFIVLSVLHVRLRVSLVAGTVSAIGLASVFVTSKFLGDGSHAATRLLPPSLEGLSVLFILAAGIAAGIVGMRMRRYLETAASEAEARARTEQDLQTAALIQQSLMPSESPAVPGYEILGWNRPADETGGDYFDWVALEGGRTAVCIADVTGHGLGPAMVTCFCRAYAKTALRVEDRIAAALNRLNAELVDDLGDGRFVTFAAVIVAPNDDRVLSASAGHGPLLIYRGRDASIESMGSDALPLGVVNWDEEPQTSSYLLEIGDVFLLITDGFFEWANPQNEQFGIKNLKASLSRHGNKAGPMLIEGLLHDVETFAAGTPQPDDLTAVVIRRTNNSAKRE